MLFNSFEFLLFLPVMVAGYYLIPFAYRWLWLLLGSYFFYMAHEPWLVILLLISTVVDYFCALQIARTGSWRKKMYLVISILVNAGMLIAFKYLSFITENIREILHFSGAGSPAEAETVSYSIGQILLPVGISFYTFQTMSYTIDVYRGATNPEKHLGKFALYVAFFPQLVAGPIERASRLLPQLKKRIGLNLENLRQGLVMMAWGFFLKVVIADRLGIYVDEAYSDPENHHGLPLLVAAFFFGFQIYYDFAGYTSIAIGAAKTMGIDLMQNFNRPFFSTSSAQFWRRWHISFMRWMMDYLYRPLVKNLGWPRIAAVLLVFFFNGLWHGASWSFVMWSMLNALFLVVELGTARWRTRLFRSLGLPRKAISAAGYVAVMGYMMLTLVFFRAPSLEEAFIYFGQMLQVTNWHVNILGNYFEFFLSFTLILFAQTVHFFKGNSRIYELIENKPVYRRWGIYLGYILVITLFAINRQNSFIYFQF